jgi:hypothetical protein
VHEPHGGFHSQRLRVHDEIETGRIVGVASEVVTDELASLTLLVVDTGGGHFSRESLCPAQSLDPNIYGLHHENTQCARRRQGVGGAASQYHTHATLRKGCENAKKLSVILRFGVGRKTVEAIMNEALDAVPHALIKTFDEISGDVFLLGNLVDDFSPEETEFKPLRNEAAEFSGA